MPDTEVENTLREIRERVRAETARTDAPHATEPAPLAPTAQANGHAQPPRPAGEALARMQANLATTERARTRLPPVTSYRRGLAARVELWLKRLIKRAAHWFTWEQVNFNSAAHHALGDALAALSAHEQGLARAHADAASLRQALEAQQQAHGRALEQSLQQVLQPLQQSQQSLHSLQQAQQSLQQWQQSLQQAQQSLEHSLRRHIAESDERTEALSSALAAAESRLAAELTTLARAFEEGVEQLRAEMGAHAEGLRGEQRAQLEARVGELHEELRERAEQLSEEQRVCFRQLSLEAGEEAVMHDRARRQIEARIEALEKAINRES
jgi:chromosome segregation ATPase